MTSVYGHVCLQCLVASVVSDSAALTTVVHQASLSLGFSRHEYWSELPCPLQGIFLTQGSNLCLLCLLNCKLCHQGSPMCGHILPQIYVAIVSKFTNVKNPFFTFLFILWATILVLILMKSSLLIFVFYGLFF